MYFSGRVAGGFATKNPFCTKCPVYKTGVLVGSEAKGDESRDAGFSFPYEGWPTVDHRVLAPRAPFA